MRRVPLNRLAPAAAPFGVAAVVVAADLLTKAWARHALVHGAKHVVGPLWLRLSFNPGFSFSLGTSMPLVAQVLSLVALGVVTALAFYAQPGWAVVGFGLLVGGGFSNLIDRLSAHPARVTDFVAFGSFPVFNVADAAVTCGLISLIGAALLKRRLLRHK